MKPGDLRRFKDNAVFPPAATQSFEGRTFLVLNVFDRVPGKRAGRVDLLVDGAVKKEWGYPWVEQNSDLLEPVQTHPYVVY